MMTKEMSRQRRVAARRNVTGACLWRGPPHRLSRLAQVALRHSSLGRPLVSRAREGSVLAAAGYNFSRLVHWLRLLLREILAALIAVPAAVPAYSGFFTHELVGFRASMRRLVLVQHPGGAAVGSTPTRFRQTMF